MCQYTRLESSIRLTNWDYRSPAFYFVTICTHQRKHIFENKTFCSIGQHTALNLPTQPHAQHVVLDEYVIMPDHVHIIFQFTKFPDSFSGFVSRRFENAIAGSLGVIVGQYKRQVTRQINQLRGSIGNKLWQRGYYERIIRTEIQLRRTRRYIQNNPIRWAEKRDNVDELIKHMTYRS